MKKVIRANKAEIQGDYIVVTVDTRLKHLAKALFYYGSLIFLAISLLIISIIYWSWFLSDEIFYIILIISFAFIIYAIFSPSKIHTYTLPKRHLIVIKKQGVNKVSVVFDENHIYEGPKDNNNFFYKNNIINNNYIINNVVEEKSILILIIIPLTISIVAAFIYDHLKLCS